VGRPGLETDAKSDLTGEGTPLLPVWRQKNDPYFGSGGIFPADGSIVEI
jgi:hypothetical protein